MKQEIIPKCPKCGNSSTCFRKDKVTVEGDVLDVIVCNGCQSVISTYIDYEKIDEMIENRVCDLEDRIDDIERTVSRISCNCVPLDTDANEDDMIQSEIEGNLDLQRNR